MRRHLKSDNFVSRIFITFGRVLLFYFILQMFAAHLCGVRLNYAAGKPIDYFFANFPDSADAPPEAGFNLAVVYAVRLIGLIALYPLCAWYGRVKQHRPSCFPFNYL